MAWGSAEGRGGQDCVCNAPRVSYNKLTCPYARGPDPGIPPASAPHLCAAKGPLPHAIQCRERVPLPSPGWWTNPTPVSCFSDAPNHGPGG